jgi:hypothetical protein
VDQGAGELEDPPWLRFNGLDIDHMPFVTHGANGEIIELRWGIKSLLDWLGWGDAWLVSKAQEPPAQGDVLSTLAIGEESVVSDSHEFPPSAGQDVEEESPNELHYIEGHRALLVAISVVLP